MSVPKLERLMNLTAALLDTHVPITAEVIHRRVSGYPDDAQAFRRAFERDKEDLREMGIPIRIEEIPTSETHESGYVVHASEYYLRDPGLEADELAALHLATAAVRLDGVQGLGGLWKLGGAPVSAPDVPQTVLTELTADPNLAVVFGAVSDRRVLAFRYGGVERTVEPQRLLFRRGRWYLAGHDRARGEGRTFRLDRVEGPMQATGPARAFQPQVGPVADLQLEPWRTGTEEPTEARVLVDATMAPTALHELGESAVVERRTDGSILVELPVTNRAALRNFVLGFLDHAELVGPPELRSDLVAWLQGIAG